MSASIIRRFIPIGTIYLSFKPGTPTDAKQGVLDRHFDQTDAFRGKEAFERRAKLTMLPSLDAANVAASNDSPTDQWNAHRLMKFGVSLLGAA